MLNIRRVASSRGGAVASSLSRASQQQLWKTSSLLVPNNLFEGSSSSSNNYRQNNTTVRSFSGIPIPGGISSLSEPGLNLFDTVPLDAKAEKPPPIVVSADVKDAQLRADIRAMGRMLGAVIQEYEGQGACTLFVLVFCFGSFLVLLRDLTVEMF